MEEKTKNITMEIPEEVIRDIVKKLEDMKVIKSMRETFDLVGEAPDAEIFRLVEMEMVGHAVARDEDLFRMVTKVASNIVLAIIVNEPEFSRENMFGKSDHEEVINLLSKLKNKGRF